MTKVPADSSHDRPASVPATHASLPASVFGSWNMPVRSGPLIEAPSGPRLACRRWQRAAGAGDPSCALASSHLALHASGDDDELGAAPLVGLRRCQRDALGLEARVPDALLDQVVGHGRGAIVGELLALRLGGGGLAVDLDAHAQLGMLQEHVDPLVEQELGGVLQAGA